MKATFKIDQVVNDLLGLLLLLQAWEVLLANEFIKNVDQHNCQTRHDHLLRIPIHKPTFYENGRNTKIFRRAY